MVNANHALLAAVSGIALVLSGCLASLPTHKSEEAKEEMNLDRVQMSDGSLTCSQIASQVSKLDEMLGDSQAQQLGTVELAAVGVAGTAAQQTATEMAVQAAVQNPSTMQYIPYLSNAMSMVSQKFANDRAIEQQNLVKAKVRKDYLVALYNQRGCLSPKHSYSVTAKKVQEDLNALGYSCGTPDGLVGPKTVTAIVQFEAERGLPTTGQATPALLERLEAELKR